MNLLTSKAIASLVRRFSGQSLAREEWTHAAHLVVGTTYVTRYGVSEALTRLRAGIRRLNGAHGTPNTDQRGYHETITRAYLELIAQVLAGCGAVTPVERVHAVVSSPLSRPDVLFAFYTKDALLSSRARLEWVEPDLEPLTASRLFASGRLSVQS